MSFCKGSHSVDGPDGCGNESCRGRELCVPTCATCPDFPNVHCQANHSVDDGCGNEDCRGQTYCVASCHDCPDFQPVIELARAGASLEQLFARARVPLSQVQSPSSLSSLSYPVFHPSPGFSPSSSSSKVTRLFGREWPPTSVRAFMACLAGPADPSVRNDQELMDKLHQTQGVPVSNICTLLEEQATRSNVISSLTRFVTGCSAGGLLFVYLGGHGNSTDGYSDWGLGTWEEDTRGPEVAPLICNVPSRVFAVADSCHSGAFIHDVEAHLATHPLMCESLTVLASTQSNQSASTGWKLLQYLIDGMTDESNLATSEIALAQHVVDNLRTSNPKQRAQLFYRQRYG
eukprot:RCo011388